MKISKPIFPREHGAWAVLFVPLTIGIAAAGKFNPMVVLLALSALWLFLSYVPVQAVARRYLGSARDGDELQSAWFWAIAYLLAGALFILPVLATGFWLLPPIGVVGWLFFLVNFLLTLRHPKTITSDLAAVAGLTLSAPSAYYVATGNLSPPAVSLWVLNFLFFGSGVFYVHMMVRARGLKKARFSLVEKLKLGRLNLFYHVIVVTIVVVMTLGHFTIQLALTAFIPMILHAVIGTAKLSSDVRFKNLGFLLLAQSAVFAMLLSALFLSQP
jgi:hypothetical protein